jgi:hypothetical protein
VCSEVLILLRRPPINYNKFFTVVALSFNLLRFIICPVANLLNCIASINRALLNKSIVVVLFASMRCTSPFTSPKEATQSYSLIRKDLFLSIYRLFRCIIILMQLWIRTGNITIMGTQQSSFQTSQAPVEYSNSFRRRSLLNALFLHIFFLSSSRHAASI